LKNEALERDFCRVFDVWPAAREYLEAMFSPAEMELVVALAGRGGTAEAVAERLRIEPAKAEALLERAYTRCMVDRETREGETTYGAANFYDFLDHFAKYENWDDLPLQVRRALDETFLEAFIDRVRENVALKMSGKASASALPNDSVMSLAEVEEMIDAATDIIVQPCDCRRLGQYCDRPVRTCIWLDGLAREALERGHGERLSREEAKKLLRWADKKGLMHTADHNWAVNGLRAICNCCACDCYPFRAAQRLGSKGVWPEVRYTAVFEREKCSFCGVCVQRCHFGAFYHEGVLTGMGGKERPDIAFDPDKCWGCGLCVNTCPTGAIGLTPVERGSQASGLLR
jgi:NAD-dependent dihydropyrimidine dehydrogenase PreA subunit